MDKKYIPNMGIQVAMRTHRFRGWNESLARSNYEWAYKLTTNEWAFIQASYNAWRANRGG